MKKIYVVIAVVFAVLFSAPLTATTAFAEEELCTSVGQAKNLYNNGYARDAFSCLEKIVRKAAANNRAVDLEIYFLMGKWAFNERAINTADEYWSEQGVAAKYAKEIAVLYRKKGLSFLPSRPQNAREMFDSAERWQRGVSLEIAAELLEIGKRKNSLEHLETAFYLNDSLREEVADYYYNLAEEAKRHNNENEYTRLINMAAKIHGKYSATAESNARALADNLFALALKEARQADLDANGVPYLNGPHEQLRRQYKQTAITILDNAGLNGKAIAEDMVPEENRLDVGFQELGFYSAGEQTPYWIRSNYQNGKTTFEPFSDDHGNGNMFFIFANGDVYNLAKKNELDAMTRNSRGGATANFVFKVIFRAPMHFALKVER